MLSVGQILPATIKHLLKLQKKEGDFNAEKNFTLAVDLDL